MHQHLVNYSKLLHSSIASALTVPRKELIAAHDKAQADRHKK